MHSAGNVPGRASEMLGPLAIPQGFPVAGGLEETGGQHPFPPPPSGHQPPLVSFFICRRVDTINLMNVSQSGLVLVGV